MSCEKVSQFQSSHSLYYQNKQFVYLGCFPFLVGLTVRSTVHLQKAVSKFDKILSPCNVSQNIQDEGVICEGLVRIHILISARVFYLCSQLCNLFIQSQYCKKICIQDQFFVSFFKRWQKSLSRPSSGVYLAPSQTSIMEPFCSKQLMGFNC